MLRNVFRAMETGALAEISLLVFAFVFAIILIRVFTLSRTRVEHDKHIPLDEPNETYQE